MITWQMFPPVFDIVLHPGDDALVDTLLGGDSDRVGADQITDLVGSEPKELVAVENLGKVALDVRLRLEEKNKEWDTKLKSA